MKHFVYFDDRLLASYFAQAFGGLTTQKQEVVGDSTSSTQTDGSTKIGSSLKGKANFIVASAAGQVDAEVISPTTSFTENQLAQELVTSTMHDNIFDRVVEHAHTNSLVNNDSPSINCYMDIEIPLKISNLSVVCPRLLCQNES